MIKKTILVVEDEMPLLKAIQARLEKEGFEVKTARKIQEAIDLMRENKIVDVIWLDHYLFGREDGLDFLSTLKQNKEWKDIPVFVVSNTASSDKIKAYLELGVNNYYTKSNYKLSEIIEDIKNNLKI